MKKNNLKRFLASLLAVLMLASATGMSPAVFAAGEDILPLTEGGEVVQPVEPVLKETSGEVLIKSNMTNEEVSKLLSKALISNYDELDDATKASLQWEYFGYGYTKKLGAKSLNQHWGTIDGNAEFTEDHVVTYTYYTQALKDLGKGTYQVRLAGTNTVATLIKVDQYTSTIVFKENATITYNMDANNMKQQIFANAIDWEKSVLPAKDTLNFDDFEYQYKALPVALEKVNDKIDLDSIKMYVDIKGYKGITDLTTFEQMGAGDQVIRVKFNGSDDYKVCTSENPNLKVEKANVKVSITSAFKFMRAGEKIDITKYVTTNPADPALELYVVYVGVNTNLESTVYLQLSGEKEKFVNGINAFLNYFDLPDLNEGITVGEFKEALNKALEKVDNKLTEFLVNQALKKYGLTYQNLKDLVDALNQIKIADNLRFAIGSPAHAGQYFATAIAVNDNYNTGISLPASVTVLKNTGLKLELNPMLNSNGKRNTITVSQAEELKASNALCTLTKSGDDLDSTSAGAIHYWFTGVGKIYAKSEMPTAPGKYIVTASVRGGDFFAMPKTFVFTIVADPTPEVTPET